MTATETTVTTATSSTTTSTAGTATGEALQAATAVVGPDRARHHLDQDGAALPLVRGANVSMFRSRAVLGVLRPRTVAEARRVVQVFDRFPGACGLQAISTGRNWGLGSREPAHDDVVTLDLGDLTEIRALDVDRGWAVVEPGVTQGQLAARLAGTTRMLNVTNSASTTSVLGNALERGVGFRAQRTDDVLGLEVLLPDGELVRVGWWPDAARHTPVYPHGLGPGLADLFVQSDLGIVTAAVRLLPRPQAQRVVRLRFTDAGLVDAVDAVRAWLVAGLVDAVPKVYDAAATDRYGGEAAAGQFVAHLCVDGTDRTIDTLVGLLVEEALASGAFVDVSASDDDRDLVDVDVAHNFAGDPSSNDAVFATTFGTTPAELDESGHGWLFFLPMVPMTGADMATAHRLKERIAAETGVRFGSVVHVLSTDYADFVLSVRFAETDRDRVHAALDLAHELFAEAGFRPYRLDVDHAAWVDRLDPDPGARALLARLKTALDPRGTIAPNRYGVPTR